jgi:hypothetical protein
METDAWFLWQCKEKKYPPKCKGKMERTGSACPFNAVDFY